MTVRDAAKSACLSGSNAAATKAVASRALTTIEAFPLGGSVETLGWGVVSSVEEWVLHPDGDKAGRHLPTHGRATELSSLGPTPSASAASSSIATRSCAGRRAEASSRFWLSTSRPIPPGTARPQLLNPRVPCGSG
jgi:hypothetical protein